MKTELHKIIRKFNSTYALVLTALFFISVFLIAFNNYQNKVRIAQSISHIIEGKLKDNQLRDVIKTLSSAQLDDFRAISYYNSQGKRTVTFPSSVDPSYFRNKSLLEELRFITFSVDLYFDQKEKIKSGTLKFSIDPYKSIPLAAMIWGLIAIVLLPVARNYKKLIIKNFEQETLASKINTIKEVERQIRHDSRGAIQAIKAVVDSSKNLDDLEVSTLNSATQRLERMISESRREKIEVVDHKIESQKEALIHVYTAITDILTEKSALFEQVGVKVDFLYNQKALSTFLEIDEFQFKRMLSNILDNSIDAIKQKVEPNSKIKIYLESEDKFLKVEIKDNGIGIKKELLPNIGIKGYTLKSEGSGLGLSWAKEKIADWDGGFKIDSEYGKGTKLTLILPIKKFPSWTTDSISIKNINNIVAIDDDPSVIGQWRRKFLKGSNNTLGFLGFESGEKFFEESVRDEKILYLVDYDLGKHTINGLNLASKINNKKSVYMVTNNFDDWEVQRFCEDFGVKLIPKTAISEIKIEGLSST